jgi:aryl-alcohol dehydrogenase-like predicted oxidoreductase
MPMQYRPFGRTGLEISLVSLGTGGPSRLGQATHADEAQSTRVVRRALDLGVNLIDTAPAYMESERLLGLALRGVPRASYLLATKVSPGKTAGTLIDAQGLIASCEASLRHLGLETIDLLQLHGPRPDLYAAIVERLYPALEQLRAAGKVRFLGVTESAAADPAHKMLPKAIASGLWDSVMIKYGILNQGAEREVLPLAQKHSVAVLDMSSVRDTLSRPALLEATLAEWKERGLLADDALPAERPLDFLIHDGVDSVVSAGYKFSAAQAAVTSVVVGTGSVAHLEANTASILGPPLPPEDEARLRALFGHVHEPVPRR